MPPVSWVTGVTASTLSRPLFLRCSRHYSIPLTTANDTGRPRAGLRRLGWHYSFRGFSKLPPKNARASRPDRSARGTRGGCRTAGRHPRRHAKSNLFAARRRPVRVPRDRRRSPSRPARRARSTRRAWPRSRAQYFEPATRAEVGAMLTADPDTLTAHDIASGVTWADRDRDSDRGGSRQRYEQTRQWHFVNIELDGRTSTAPALSIRGCPRPCRHQAGSKALHRGKFPRFPMWNAPPGGSRAFLGGNFEKPPPS